MMKAVALCAIGAEKALSNELKKLSLRVLEGGFGRVHFEADLAGLYLALFSLRTADRVLLEAASFPAKDFDALFEGVKAVHWEDLIIRGRSVVIGKVRSRGSALAAETSIQSVSHKAVAERLTAAWGMARIPDYEEQAQIRVYLEKDQASILLDLSGEPLFHRGYRTEGGAAPLRETTAAAIILLSGWKRKFPLYDPFCGSGTFASEAALYAWDCAPGIGRSFALSNLAFGDKQLEEKIRSELKAKVDFNRIIRIQGSDSDPRAVSIAQSNIERAFELAKGLPMGRGIRLLQKGDDSTRATLPTFRVLEMAEAAAPWEDTGFILTNPPYGERLGDRASAEKTYREMQALPEHFPGWTMAVVTNHPGFESHFGKKASSMREITNGALLSYLYLFDPSRRPTYVDRRRTR